MITYKSISLEWILCLMNQYRITHALLHMVLLVDSKEYKKDEIGFLRFGMILIMKLQPPFIAHSTQITSQSVDMSWHYVNRWLTIEFSNGSRHKYGWCNSSLWMEMPVSLTVTSSIRGVRYNRHFLWYIIHIWLLLLTRRLLTAVLCLKPCFGHSCWMPAAVCLLTDTADL